MPRRQYQQTQANSCGASTLMCAALELGTAQLPATPRWPLWTNAMDLDTTLACEMAIYSVTCGGGGMPPGRDAGYSMPSHIFEAAQAMGRTVTAYVPYSLMGMALTTAYASDVQRAQGLGMTVNRSGPPRPADGQRLLRVVRVGSNSWYSPALGLHYILERPDGSIMDPALGMDTNGLASLQQFHDRSGASYIDTGIGLLVT